jgi:hypothetical protein
MNSRQIAIAAAALFGTVVLVGGVIAAVAGFGMADIKNTNATRIEDRATEMGDVSVSNADVVSAAGAVTAIHRGRVAGCFAGVRARNTTRAARGGERL